MHPTHCQEQLISVIVPAYKVEEYLEHCIESITKQSYQNIEIIIINDGSPDNSGKIADNLALIDSRIKVIHTENKGVSAARNLGIDVSNGKYIAFVDSDDHLEPDFVAYMLRLTEKTGAPFVMSTDCFKYANDSQVEDDSFALYSPEKAASELLYPRIDIGCWNKLFLKSFLLENDIKFPVAFHMGEGLNFIVNAAQSTNGVGVGVGRRKVYHYRKDNADSATTKISAAKFVNALAAIDNIAKNSTLTTEEFTIALRFHRYITTFYGLYAIIRTGAQNAYKNEYIEWATIVRREALSMMKARVPVSMKIKILFYSASPTTILSARCSLGAIKRKLLARS